MTHSIPDAMRGRARRPTSARSSSPATTSSTRRRSTACPPTSARLAELGREGLLLLCGDSTNADRPGFSPSESIVGPHLEEVFARCEGRIVVTCFASNIHRVQQVVDAAAALGPQGRASSGARCARTSTSAARSGTSTCPRACSSSRASSTTSPTTSSSIISTGSQGEPLSALRRMAHRDHPQVELHEGDTVVFTRDADPRQRARGQRDDRPALPHRLRRHHDRATRRSTPPATATRRRSS